MSTRSTKSHRSKAPRKDKDDGVVESKSRVSAVSTPWVAPEDVAQILKHRHSSEDETAPVDDVRIIEVNDGASTRKSSSRSAVSSRSRHGNSTVIMS